MSLSAQFDAMARANAHGLVAMKFLHGFHVPYQVDAIAGFPPDRALLFYVEQSAVPVDADGKVVMAPIEGALKSGVEIGDKPGNSVNIPQNWEAFHHLQRIRLAKEIRGTDEAITVTVADEIIRTELQRKKVQP